MQTPTVAVGNYSNVSQIPPPNLERRYQNTFRFVSSGVQIKERGVVEIAKAFKMLKSTEEAELAFSGIFREDSLKEQLNNILLEIPSHRSFSITGPHNWEELTLQEIPKAHVGFVLFDTSDQNNREGLPNRFFECWSNGLAIITNDGTRVSELVKQENGGVVIPDYRPETLVKAMEELISNPKRAQEMGQNGRMAVEKHYSWEVAFKSLLSLYDRLSI